MNSLRVKNVLDDVNSIGYSNNGINRLAFTMKEQKAKNIFIHYFKQEGMKVKIDECGNVIAHKKGKNPGLSPVIIGSHLDTVFDGGQYDGIVGVVLGLELILSLKEQNITTNRSIEVIIFSGEEASRFGIGTIGSKAITGKLNKNLLFDLIDNKGITFQEALEEIGLDISNIENASRKKEKIHAFFEIHIEQGPILEQNQKKIGIVNAIAAPTRLKVDITGRAAHSGTTPMNYRQDALLGASEIALALEKAAKKESNNGTVATVGECGVPNGAINVIPQKAKMKIDIRGTNRASKQEVLSTLKESFHEIKLRRNLEIDYKILSKDSPVKLNTKIIKSLSETCEQLDIPYLNMDSGAGHDIMHMASLCPAGLIFIPCKQGISHHKDEHTSIENISFGFKVLKKEILKWCN